MTSFFIIIASLVLLFLTVNFCLAEEKVDLSGTWEGVIYIPGIDIEMDLVLVLVEKKQINYRQDL